MFNRKTKSLLLVLVMLVSAAGVAFAAAPSVDTETTNTSQTSDLTDGSTQTYNTSTASNFSWSADSENSKLIIKQNGTVLREFTPSNYSAKNTTGGSALDKWYYNVSLADDGSDYTGLEANANENVTLTFTLVNNTSASSPDTTNVTVYFKNGETEVFTRADSAKQEPTGGLFSSLSVPFMNSSDSVPAAKTTQTIDVTGNTSTITFQSNQANLTDALSETYASAEGTDGPAWNGWVMVNGQPVVMFAEGANIPDWVGDQRYATVDSDGTVTVHQASGLFDSGTSTVDVTVVGNEAAGFSKSLGILSAYDVGTLQKIQLADGPDVNGNPDYEDASA